MNINEIIDYDKFADSNDELVKYLILIKTKFYIKFYNDLLSNSLKVPDELMTIDGIALSKIFFDDTFKKL